MTATALRGVSRCRRQARRHRVERLVLFGATGDLAGRFLLPGLAQLQAAGELPDGLRIVGAAPEDWDDETFLDHAARRLERHAGDVPAGRP